MNTNKLEFFFKSKKAQEATTLTWIPAAIIISLIMVGLVFVTSSLAGEKFLSMKKNVISVDKEKNLADLQSQRNLMKILNTPIDKEKTIKDLIFEWQLSKDKNAKKKIEEDVEKILDKEELNSFLFTVNYEYEDNLFGDYILINKDVSVYDYDTALYHLPKIFLFLDDKEIPVGLYVGTKEIFGVYNQGVKVPEDPKSFWENEMTTEMANKWSTTTKGAPQCLAYLIDMLQRNFPDYVSKIFYRSDKDINLINSWIKNDNLIRLSPNQYEISDIQAMADKGLLILMSYDNPNSKQEDHFAFIGHSELILFSDPVKSETGASPPQNRKASADEYPVLVQAGTFTGITWIAWGSNGWNKVTHNLFKNGIIKFYAIKKG
jgi:hypothetical protein